MKDLLGKRLSPAEMLQRLNIQRVRLEQLHTKMGERMDQGKQEAKKCLERGDESGFRVGSRKYVLSKNTAGSINDLKDMALEMIDLVEMGGILHSVIEAGGDLAKIQGRLGLDSTKLESSLAKISSSMTHMEDIANVLSATIESSLTSPKQLSTDQEILRKELLAEMATERVEAEKLKEKVSRELERVEKR